MGAPLNLPPWSMQRMKSSLAQSHHCLQFCLFHSFAAPKCIKIQFCKSELSAHGIIYSSFAVTIVLRDNKLEVFLNQYVIMARVLKQKGKKAYRSSRVDFRVPGKKESFVFPAVPDLRE